MVHRREFMGAAVVAGGAAAFDRQFALADEVKPPTEIVDTNVNLFQWPFRRLPLDTTPMLIEKLRGLGIKRAWAGSFEGILHRDITSVNDRLAESCRDYDELVPIGSINPELPSWEQDLAICISKYRMPGIRIHPNYHGYQLDDPSCIRLIQLATQAGRFVQIAAQMEDPRTQHLLVQVPDVHLTRLPNVMQQCQGAKVQILNDRPASQILDLLAKTSGVFFDVSRVDGTDGISKLLRSVPSERILFGSHAPFLIPEAALIRVYESNLGAQQLQSLMWKNAQRLNPSLDEPEAERS